jgi:hypothetical protein
MPHTRRENSKWKNASEAQIIQQEKKLDSKTKDAEAIANAKKSARTAAGKPRSSRAP